MINCRDAIASKKYYIRPGYSVTRELCNITGGQSCIFTSGHRGEALSSWELDTGCRVLMAGGPGLVARAGTLVTSGATLRLVTTLPRVFFSWAGELHLGLNSVKINLYLESSLIAGREKGIVCIILSCSIWTVPRINKIRKPTIINLTS